MNIKQNTMLACVLCTMLCMTACGDPKPPTSYTSGETSLPSLTELVELPEDYTCEETQDEENGTATYTYSGLENSGETVEQYTTLLTEEHNCTLVQQEDFSKPSGTVVAGMESESGDGMMELSISWDDGSCSITPSFSEGKTLSSMEPMTLQEILAYFSTLPPQSLGIDANRDYSTIPRDGVVMVDDHTCLRLDVYYNDDHQIAGSFLISQRCEYIYRLDSDTNSVSVIFSPKPE